MFIINTEFCQIPRTEKEGAPVLTQMDFHFEKSEEWFIPYRVFFRAIQTSFPFWHEVHCVEK